ncbi:cytochrome P450 [Acrasis kona]|uniref:Cytochrome P450 n=1 Tax=Acrasis kona TaxID=1008807 RepID=A0AAW2Z9A4_9EUKA
MYVILALLCIPVIVVLAVYAIDYRARNRFKRANNQAKHSIMPTLGIVKSLSNIIVEPFKKNKSHLSQLLHEAYLTVGKDNGIYHKFLGPIDNIVIADVDAIKTVLLNPKSFPKFPLHLSKDSPTARFSGRNLAFIEGEEWKAQRHVINPAFYNLNKFFEPFDLHTKKCLDLFASKNGQPIAIPLAMTNFTIDVLGETVIGTNFGAQDGNLDRTTLEDLLYLMAYSFQPARLLFSFINKLPTKANREFEVRLQRFNHFIGDLVSAAEDKFKNRNNNNGDNAQETLLDLMIQSAHSEYGQGLSDSTVRDNAVAFFIAGHETTSSALGFAFYRLSKHPEAQQRLYNEIKDTLNGDDLNTDLIQNMNYLDAFIKETMRMHPPAAGVLGRVNVEDVVMCGYKIPKGTMISPDFYSLHYNKEYYGPSVNEFRPERFLGEEGKSIPRFAHLPFSAGARVCIGNHFSVLEQKVFLARLLLRFEILPNPDYRYKVSPSSILCISDDFTVTVKERK